MSQRKLVTTARGRPFVVLGDASVTTMDRLAIIEQRLDADPRIATVSVVPHTHPGTEFMRATSPAGVAVAVSCDLSDLVGELSADATAEELTTWARRASERGMWHDWWLTPSRDVARASELLAPSDLDLAEAGDLASSHFVATGDRRADLDALAITVDVA